MSSTVASPTAVAQEPAPKKRAVDLLSPEQLERKRKGDKNAQRQRRERLKAQIETLQGQVSQLQEQNSILQERLAASTPPTLMSTSTAPVTSSFPDDGRHNAVQAPSVSSVAEQRNWSETDESPSVLSQGQGAQEDASWSSMAVPEPISKTSESEPGIEAPVELGVWDDDPMKLSIFQMLNENPPGFGFTVWSQSGFANDTGPGGLPTEFAAAVESMSALQPGPGCQRYGGHSNSQPMQQRAARNVRDSFNPGTNSTVDQGCCYSRDDPASKKLPKPPAQSMPSIHHTASNQVWAAVPRHGASTCLVDRVVIDLIRNRRLQDNAPEFQRHHFPSIRSLLNPSREATNTRAPVTSSIVNNIVPVTTIPTLPEQIAILYVMSTLIRWQIQPTEAHYDAMPVWLRPGAAQLAVPHAPWIDFMAWPLLRERMCRWPKYHDQHHLVSSLCNQSLSINWRYRVEDIVIYFDGEEVVLNPVFNSHIRDINNWTLGRKILSVFPEFEGEVNFKDV